MQRRYGLILLAAMCAVGLRAETASATLSLNQAAAMVVTPFVATGVTAIPAAAPPVIETYATITNSGAAPVELSIQVVNGGGTVAANQQTCDSQSTTCQLTGNETTLFRFFDEGGGFTRVQFNCAPITQGVNNPPIILQPRVLDISTNQGFMVVTASDPVTGAAISSNVLFADWVAVDYTKLTAFGAEAITFQGVSALANNGDSNFAFDGKEYSTFPAQLASNFIPTTPGLAPSTTPLGGTVTGELILLTLDVTLNSAFTSATIPKNPVALNGHVYDDKELEYNFQYNFDCFTIVPLDRLSPQFTAQGLAGGALQPATSGHFDLTPVSTLAGDPAHEADFGTGNTTRNRPAVGWIVQSLNSNGRIDSGPPFSPAGAGTGSWARTLGTSTVAFTPNAGDTPTLSTP